MHFLKFLALLKLKIFNDPLKSSEIEKKIEDINKKDSTLDKGTVNSLTILNGNVVSIIASFSKEQGKIINHSERTPEFFGYTNIEFNEIKSVLQIMPDIIAFHHDFFIERLIT